MKDDKLPIKFFAKREVDQTRIEGGGSSVLPNWVLKGEDLVKKSFQLYGEIEPFEELVAKRKKEGSIIPFVFNAKLFGEATAKSRRNDVESVFQTDSTNNIIGLSGTDELIVQVRSEKNIKSIAKRLKQYDKYSKAISCLEKLKLFSPKVEAGKRQNYKIKLIHFNDYSLDNAIETLFESTVRQLGLHCVKTAYAKSYKIFNLKNVDSVGLDGLRASSSGNAIFSIEPMPKYSIALDFVDTQFSMPVSIPEDEKDYEIVGVLDNGIIASNSHLSPWLHGAWSPYPASDRGYDHGTFVAGIVVYGDMLEGTTWTGCQGVKIFDAAVFPRDGVGIDEDELIRNIKEAISLHHNDVKIWNLSLSVVRKIKKNSFSDFAIALDSLQDEYGVLICKSAGNCTNFIDGKPVGKIFQGADSIRSLVVGSIAHDRSQHDIAEIDNPSPFSRCGPGPEYIIKPEVVHYGGNAGVDSQGGLTQTGVKSLSVAGGICTSIGTSFSTPRIACLAAGLQQEINEDFNLLLLKSLIIHSATYSNKLEVPNEERTNFMGFGLPKSVNNIIYNSQHEITLILNDTLARGEKIDIMDFPMPKCLIENNFYRGQVIVTLVYSPILDASQGGEYCQSNLEVKFGSYDSKMSRDTNKPTILNPIGRAGSINLLNQSCYSKRKSKSNNGDFALMERLRIQYDDKYYPVKKYAVDFAELTDSKRVECLASDRNWFLSLQGLYRNHTETKSALQHDALSQDFCMIITIRDPQFRENVYDAVTQSLEENNFWHSNISISSDIRLNP